MQNGITFESLHNVDPDALSLVFEKRAIYHITKRVIDIALALLVLIILFPLILLIAILIKLDSPGPVIFVQDRVGIKRRIYGRLSYLQKVTFRCYKFRTMVCNADPALHKSYLKALINNDCAGMATLQGENTQIRKLTRDPRITRIGRLLRKCSIDEIPQFLNVLKGEMSIVGPRPAIPYEVEMYKSWHYQRLETKPGITGWWQVTARSSAEFDEMIKLDIEYIQRQSLWFDLKIILRTPLAIISCKGAM